MYLFGVPADRKLLRREREHEPECERERERGVCMRAGGTDLPSLWSSDACSHPHRGHSAASDF